MRKPEHMFSTESDETDQSQLVSHDSLSGIPVNTPNAVDTAAILFLPAMTSPRDCDSAPPPPAADAAI